MSCSETDAVVLVVSSIKPFFRIASFAVLQILHDVNMCASARNSSQNKSRLFRMIFLSKDKIPPYTEKYLLTCKYSLSCVFLIV